MGMRIRRGVGLLLIGLWGCNGSEPAKSPKRGETIRYRLLLRENPVSPRDAMHCYSECQSTRTPNEYIGCLSKCPGWEETDGEYCSNTEIPPLAACLTVRKVPAAKEVPPGMVVLAVVGEIALVVGAASLCSISSSQCGMQMPPPQ
jgi:hypothetical protein